MVAVKSMMLPLGTECPHFTLQDVSGKTVSDTDFAGRPLLIAFICNHCPFVKHIRPVMTDVFNRLMHEGAGVVAINSNNAAAYPDDRPEQMKTVAEEAGFAFPYLFDETQDVAKSFYAACTPDFYVFNQHHRLIYRGQFDDSRPDNDEPITGRDIVHAVNAALEGETLTGTQRSSIGCNIKWKPGNEPAYYQ